MDEREREKGSDGAGSRAEGWTGGGAVCRLARALIDGPGRGVGWRRLEKGSC